MKICRKCGTELIINKNWCKTQAISRNYVCHDCENKRQKKWRKENKERVAIREARYRKNQRKELDKLKVNGCAICGYNKCNAVLDFHHVNPQDKKFSLQCSAMNRSLVNIIIEVNKCILLCSNCHKEIHYGGKYDENFIHTP